MTAPLDPQDRADQLADRLKAVSEDASTLATEGLRGEIRALIAALIARWVLRFGNTEESPRDTISAVPFVEDARELIVQIALGEGPQRVLEEAVDAGYALGLEHARAVAPDLPLIRPERPERRLPDLEAVLADQKAQALRALDERALVESGVSVVAQAGAKLERAATRVEANVAYETTRAANDAVRDATPDGWRVVWVAERDACLHCLAYAGVTAAPGALFPEGLTFADRPMAAHEPLLGPPRHPHCRCSLQPLHPTDAAVSDGLKREARRSVLRGWSDHDSLPERLRAADRLLARGADLPKTVEARARRAVRDGRFN